jgi:peptide/nickel transport system permease protein
MRAYVIRRLLLLVPNLLLVSLIIFFVAHLIPGDIVDAIMSQSLDQVMERSELEKKYGLEAPLLIQYARWMGFAPRLDGSFSGILQGDLGTSWWRHVPVLKLVSLKWPVTFELGLLALIVAQLIALPIGIFSALRQDTWGDYTGRSFAILCISIPGFWLGTLIIVYPSIWWDYMPSISLIHFAEDPIGNLKMFIVPAIVLGMSLAGITMRMTRTMMLEVLRQDYIRTAWSKGLKEGTITRRHALKNALIPVVTIIGLQAPVLIGGTVIIEEIFVLPGMGRLIIEATLRRDQQLISGIVILFAIALMLINMVVDLTYALLDPRVEYK